MHTRIPYHAHVRPTDARTGRKAQTNKRTLLHTRLPQTGALIPSLRRTDRLGERFNDEQIDAILDSVQNFLLGISDGGMGGGAGDGMEGEEEAGEMGETGGDAMEEDGGGGGGEAEEDEEEEEEF